MQIARLLHPRALLIAILLTLAFSASALAQDDASGELGSEALAIANAINNVRTSNGLPPLRVHALLNQAAQAHVNDLIANNMYGHYGSDGSSVRTRVGRTGYPSQWVSENWVTSGSPQGAMDWWMNDWIHRVNILEDNWDEVGIGAGLVANGYWIFVTDFADADGNAVQAAVISAPPAESIAVPASNAPELESAIPAGGMDYSIRGGDTLLAIGLRFGIEWQDVALANGMGESTMLRIGQVIRLPGTGAEVTAAAADLPAGGKLYTVARGDTLITIATRHSIAWVDIAAANGIADPSLLQIGMQLRLPGVPEEGTESAGSDEDTGSAPAANEEVSVALGSAAYTVSPGDTLSGIAGRHGLTWQELASLNGLGSGAVLQIGQALLVPSSATTAPVAELPASPAGVNYTTELLNAAPEQKTSTLALGATTVVRSYTVKAGDTIISIAVRNSINWKKLLELNGLADDTLIQPGQVLNLE